ncbi:hypothetical protein F5144DRAFT_225093 [Chaetomium tenue]|uniref:Uncharacterized protein n=1 Tax=Chaetomium tenue TaxID=1854479 RepID=A0ACB7P5M9_9PEZI|nr:hypothetical protein F5144DRAFT_225093 [Chaetomium globosum]
MFCSTKLFLIGRCLHIPRFPLSSTILGNPPSRSSPPFRSHTLVIAWGGAALRMLPCAALHPSSLPMWAPLSLALSTLALLSFKLCLSLSNPQFFASPIRPSTSTFPESKTGLQSCTRRLDFLDPSSFVLEAHHLSPSRPLCISRLEPAATVATLDHKTTPLSTFSLALDTSTAWERLLRIKTARHRSFAGSIFIAIPHNNVTVTRRPSRRTHRHEQHCCGRVRRRK